MTKVRRASLPLLAWLLTIPAAACAQAPAPAGTSDDPAALITAEDIYNRIYFLASDGLSGRDTPSPGLEAAAAYLVSEHRRMGLSPGVEGSFYQRWPYRLLGPEVENASLSLSGAAGERSLVVGADVALQGALEEEISADLVFVGAVDTTLDEGSLAGRVAVFSLPAPDGWTQQVRQRAAQQARFADIAGAVASIHVLNGLPAGQMEAMARQLASPGRVMGHELPFPRIYLAQAAAAGAIPDLGSLLQRADAGESFTLATEARLSGRVPVRIEDDAHPANVVAVIPGSDPALADEYVVLSAHYDHVGTGRPDERGDTIYNGADDNASGTAVLLETARAITSMGEAPRRSVAFVHVSGEEKGLLGSRWFAENAPWPVEQIVANINADMVAGDTHRDTLVVIGKDYSSLGPLVDGINDSMPELGLVTSDDLWPEQRFFFRSDQLNFMRMEIPSLFFFTGVHECYHRPCDEPDFVDADKAARIARLLTHSVLAIANADARPEWDPAGLAEVRERTGGR